MNTKIPTRQEAYTLLTKYNENESLIKLAAVMYRSCGQMIDPFGSHGEQLQNTNFAQ